MAYNDVSNLIAVGLIWGATNAFMRRGLSLSSSSSAPSRLGPLGSPHYSVPLLVNLAASAAFFRLLAGAPISLAVPVTNAVTFAATAVTAVLLGERVRVGRAVVGLVLIVIGVWICVSLK